MSITNIYEVTAQESKFLELEATFEFYRVVFKKEYELFMSAFMNKHSLFPEVNKTEDTKKPSADDLYKIGKMMRMMEDAHMHKHIGPVEQS